MHIRKKYIENFIFCKQGFPCDQAHKYMEKRQRLYYLSLCEFASAYMKKRNDKEKGKNEGKQ